MPLPKQYGLSKGWPIGPGQFVPGPPANSVAPAVTGTAQSGSTLSCSTGTWSNSPTIYAYQWTWADTGAAILGATASTYVLVAGDVGHTILCVVTASNLAGPTSVPSNTTSAVTASGGGGSASLDFSQATNSQYVPLLAA